VQELDALLDDARRQRIDGRRRSRSRADVRAAAAGHAAARADVRRARSAWLPRLNGMARFDWNSPDASVRGAGELERRVVASWTPFAGARSWPICARRRVVSRWRARRPRPRERRRNWSWQRRRMRGAWPLERLRIADDAVAQSVEAHRIVTRKYEGGLAAVVELLGASAAETEARLRRSHARWETIVRAAERLQAAGQDPARLAGWAMDS
jgi:outer membrane protein TolC